MLFRTIGFLSVEMPGQHVQQRPEYLALTAHAFHNSAAGRRLFQAGFLESD
jgi:hypothetical protein